MTVEEPDELPPWPLMATETAARITTMFVDMMLFLNCFELEKGMENVMPKNFDRGELDEVGDGLFDIDTRLWVPSLSLYTYYQPVVRV